MRHKQQTPQKPRRPRGFAMTVAAAAVVVACASCAGRGGLPAPSGSAASPMAAARPGALQA